MWLKVYYPTYFMASTLSSLIGEKIEDMIPYFNECKVMGIKLLPPNIHSATKYFTVSDDEKSIHYSLTGIKGVGPQAVEAIIDMNQKHKIVDIKNFIMLSPSAVNKTVLTSLAKAGAFDSFGYNRKTMTKAVEELLQIRQKINTRIKNNAKRKRPVQDISVFYEPWHEYQIEILDEYTLDELCKLEKELLGVYITHHPLDDVIEYLRSRITMSSKVLNNGVFAGYDENEEEVYEPVPAGTIVKVGGVIKSVKEITIRNGRNRGRKMASFVIEDIYQGDISVTAFCDLYEKNKGIIQEGRVVLLRGAVDYYNESPQIKAQDIAVVDKKKAKYEQYYAIINRIGELQEMIAQLQDALDLIGDDMELAQDISAEMLDVYEELEKLEEERKQYETSLDTQTA